MREDVGMDLDVCVAETLLAILSGVRRAQADETLGHLVGRPPDKVLGALPRDGEGVIVTTVAFELAISVDAKSTRTGKSALKVVPWSAIRSAELGGDGASSVSRIAFEIPITIPDQPVTDADESLSQGERALRARGLGRPPR